MAITIQTTPGLRKRGDQLTLELAEGVFGTAFNEPLVHQLITKVLADERSGTKKQKSRAEVSGGGAKPWRQKGSGRARAGSSRSPIWRTGGVTFAARPRDHRVKLNRKMYRAGMRSIFSELVRQDRIYAVDDIYPAQGKTRDLIAKLRTYEISGKVLIISDVFDQALFLAGRNVRELRVCTDEMLSPVDLLNCEVVIATSKALMKIEDRLK